MKSLGSIASAGVVFVLALTLFPERAGAADYPERQLVAIVPYAPGSTTDTMARRVSPLLAKGLGQQVIIQNRAGAEGRIGTEAMTKAAPDGYTILFTGAAIAMTPAIRKNISWDPVRQVQPVAELGESAYVIVVNPTVPANNLAAFVNLAKNYPGKLNGSAGGDSTGMALALFRIKTGSRAETITYKGTGLAALAVVSGEVDFAILDASAWLAFIPSGRVRALAVAGKKRLSALPEIPTTDEAGLPDYHVGSMFGVYTTGGVPMNIVRRLNAEINNIITAPDMARGLNRLGLAPTPLSVEQFTQRYMSDLAKWKEVVKRANLPILD